MNRHQDQHVRAVFIDGPPPICVTLSSRFFLLSEMSNRTQRFAPSLQPSSWKASLEVSSGDMGVTKFAE